MRAIRWDQDAKADLDELWFHIAQDNLTAADKYLDGLSAKRNPIRSKSRYGPK
jgi:plasmid stabilization system protein ParE